MDLRLALHQPTLLGTSVTPSLLCTFSFVILIFSHFNQTISSEISGVADKIKRCVNYLFHQKSFYPLNPPSLDVYLDSELAAKYAQLNRVPNMLVVPSDTKQFIRVS